jgi:malonic semialdehyde reductase
MNSIKQPPIIIFGQNSIINYDFPKNVLLISSSGANSRGWIKYLNLKNYFLFENVESNPSMSTVELIISKFKNKNFDYVIGLGGGSVLDVAKFVGYKLNKPKILISTTFGSGSEVTRISVLKIDGKKTSFHNDDLFADIAIVDPFFIKSTPIEIIKNSAIDACAQCSEAYDSKISNEYTKFLCKKAFSILEKALIEKNYEDLAYGAMISGLGFGNSSTTFGHALSYVFSNEGISHGHALAFTTTLAHKFNNSIFYERFLNLIKLLDFKNITLKEDFSIAADLILTDHKHIDNNPNPILKSDIVKILKIINNG